MSDNWNKLQSKKVNSELTNRLERKYNHLKKVVCNPDKYNVNIATKDDIESIAQQIEELSDLVNNVIERINKLEK